MRLRLHTSTPHATKIGVWILEDINLNDSPQKKFKNILAITGGNGEPIARLSICLTVLEFKPQFYRRYLDNTFILFRNRQQAIHFFKLFQFQTWAYHVYRGGGGEW